MMNERLNNDGREKKTSEMMWQRSNRGGWHPWTAAGHRPGKEEKNARKGGQKWELGEKEEKGENRKRRNIILLPPPSDAFSTVMCPFLVIHKTDSNSCELNGYKNKNKTTTPGVGVAPGGRRNLIASKLKINNKKPSKACVSFSFSFIFTPTAAWTWETTRDVAGIREICKELGKEESSSSPQRLSKAGRENG